MPQGNNSLPFMVVGVGASAGGLEALNDFFGQINRTPGVAFIVVQHLSYEFKSMMGQLLSKQTDIKVVNARHGMAVEPDHVYMLPFRAELKLLNGLISLVEKAPTSGVNHPIDMLFESIAREQRDNGGCVVLSGSGSDGTVGVRAIKEAGGLVLVQEPASTQFDSMPHSALATGMADFVGTPASLAEDLCSFVDNPLNRGDMSAIDSNIEQRALNELIGIMQTELRIDFASYKRDGVVRRLQKRLRATHSVSIADYTRYLRSHPDELSLLEESMLINVTRFLRDNEAWEVFQKQCVEPMVESLPEGSTLRAWVAGCSTGQEAYTMGVMFDRVIRRSGRKLEYRIFATDVDRRAIAKAGLGEYRVDEIAGIPEDEVSDYFTSLGDRRVVRRSVRDRITFAPHNLMVDPPFTKLHFISCRNLLIYLSQDAQDKVLSRFEFSLLPGSALFLGASETVGQHSASFRTVDAKWKIFERLEGVGLSPPRTFSSALPYSGLSARRPPPRASANDSLYEAVIEKYVPSGAAIDVNFNIIHVFGALGSVLSLPAGRTTLNLLKMVPESTSAILSATIRKAIKDEAEVCCRLPLPDDDNPPMLRVVPAAAKTPTLVFFETAEAPITRKPMVVVDLDVETARRIQELEEDTATLRQSLQAAVQEHEMANEELQATNEELIASNEELQSTNEELQSVNEELYTVNTEYQEKIGELERVNEDLEHVLATTQSGVLILDQHLNIRRYNTGCLGIFPLLAQDVGRPIGDIALRAKNFELEAAMHKLLETGEPFAEDVTTDDKRVWGLTGRRLMRKGNDVGIILTITDLSQLRPHLVRRLDRLLTCFSVAGVGKEVPALVVDVDSGESDITEAARRILGLQGEIVQVAEILGMTSGSDRRTLEETFNKLINKEVPGQMVEQTLPSLGQAENVTIRLAARISHYNASRVLVALLSESPVVEA
ncbi:MAG: chemotaxis protein CheB [Polyangiales bacterium]